MMADGREERQEKEQRRQWDEERNREGRLDRYPPDHDEIDQWKPERRES